MYEHATNKLVEKEKNYQRDTIETKYKYYKNLKKKYKCGSFVSFKLKL